MTTIIAGFGGSIFRPAAQICGGRLDAMSKSAPNTCGAADFYPQDPEGCVR
jgi:hypothetical protein